MTEIAGLEQGERVLWEGRPARLAYAVNRQLLLAEGFFLLLFVAFAVSMLAAPIPQEVPPFMLLPLLLVLLAFPAFVVLPGMLAAWREAPHLRYVLTEWRAIVVAPRRRLEVQLGMTSYVEMRPWSMNTSAIYFAPPFPGETLSFMWPSGGYVTPAFRAIADGERVYRLVLEARERLRRT